MPSRENLDSSKNPLSTTLHYADKKSCQEAAEHVKTVSSINVHQLTMRHEMSHELELFLDREGLKNLWKVLFSTAPSKLINGLLGLTLSSHFTVWLKKPISLRLGERSSVGELTSLYVQTLKMASGAYDVHVHYSSGYMLCKH